MEISPKRSPAAWRACLLTSFLSHLKILNTFASEGDKFLAIKSIPFSKFSFHSALRQWKLGWKTKINWQIPYQSRKKIGALLNGDINILYLAIGTMDMATFVDNFSHFKFWFYFQTISINFSMFFSFADKTMKSIKILLRRRYFLLSSCAFWRFLQHI